MPRAAAAKKPFEYGTPRFEDVDIDWLAERPWPKNAKAHDLAFLGEVFGENGFAEFPVFDEGSGKMVAGHGRVEKLVKMRDAGETAPPRVKVKDGKWLVPTIRGMTFPKPGKHVLASNRGVERGGWDNTLLAAALTTIGKDDLVGTGFGADDFATFLAGVGGGAGGATENAYTKKIQAPIYEPKGEKPNVSELCGLARTESLLAEISKAKVPDDVKAFLRLAAQRHAVFDYEKIAEFYAHAPKEVQELFEASALVIIDFKKAIENGFVVMTEEIADAYPADSKDEAA